MKTEKLKEGAMLMQCGFCGAVRVILEWIEGHGWSCPGCGTNVKGNSRK